MHEHSITKNIVVMVVKECQKNNLRPKKVVVELGSLTTYKKEPIMFYFEALKKDFDVLEDAKLEINEVKGMVNCNKCTKESEVEDPSFIICRHCKSHDVKIVQGKDFIIKEIQG